MLSVGRGKYFSLTALQFALLLQSRTTSKISIFSSSSDVPPLYAYFAALKKLGCDYSKDCCHRRDSVVPGLPIRCLSLCTLTVLLVGRAAGMTAVKSLRGLGDHGDHIDVDGAYALVDFIKRALVHELHADADARVRQECTVKRDNIPG